MKRTRSDFGRPYRWLLKLYPAQFREEYEAPMERQFRDELRDAQTTAARAKLWITAVLDVAVHAPARFAEEAWQDLRYTLHVYRNRSTSGLLAAAALALAIGASTGVFSVLNAVLIRSLPFSDPHTLAEIWRPPTEPLNGRAAFLDWGSRSTYLDGAAAFYAFEVNLGGDRGALRVKAAETSANLFALLGTKPLLGRGFAPEEDVPGRSGVAIIGYNLWQQAFGGDPGVIGSKVRVNGAPVEVIGVAPPRFDYPEGAALWIPSAFDFERLPKRGAFFFRTVARFSVPPDTAREMFEAEIARANPAALKDPPDQRPKLLPLRERLAGPVGGAVWALTGLTVLILLAACANVGQLLLSRASERREEFAMRAALGASRARLIQQLITEALALTGSAAALGLLIAHQVCSMAASVAPAQLATQQYTVLDWRVAVFAAGLAVSIGVVFGVLPVLTGWHKSGNGLRGDTASVNKGAIRTRWALLALQTAVTLTLATGALGMGRSFLRLLRADLGFTPAQAVTLKVSLHGTRHDGNLALGYYDDVLRELRAVPGVEAAGAVSYLPLASEAFIAGSFKLDSGQVLNSIVVNSASADYFRAVGTQLLAGRDFHPNETRPVVIVNEAFAEQTGLGRHVVGRSLTGSWTSEPYLIVGVVETARFAGPSYPGGPKIYWRIEEEPPPSLAFIARMGGDAEAALAMCRDAVRSVDPAVPVYDVKTLERRLADALARPKFYTVATLFLGGLAVLVVALGIYGSAARAVAQRRREVGIRMAIGANSWQIRTLVLRRALGPVTVGAGAGLAGALATGRYMEHLIANAEPVTFAGCTEVAAVLVGVATAAAWQATARVLSIHPAEAVRVE